MACESSGCPGQSHRGSRPCLGATNRRRGSSACPRSGTVPYCDLEGKLAMAPRRGRKRLVKSVHVRIANRCEEAPHKYSSCRRQ